MMRRSFLCWMAASLLAIALPAGAADLSATDAKSVRAVIQSQLAAFAADDAPRAFSFATPQLRRMFGDADNFMRMVRTSYPVVYRPATVAFLKPRLEQGVVTQAVHFTDGNGALWLALYRLERQPERNWRISACQVVQAEGRAA
jgi:Domain of unknown function (DUF4864)